MVRHAALGIIVSTDFGGTVAGGNHRLALGGNLVEILLVLQVIEPGTKFLERAVLVLELRALLLTLHHEPRGDMRQAHGGIGGVHALAAGTGRTEQIQPDIVPTQVHVEFSRFREDRDGSRRSLDTALRFGLGHTLHAVHAGFVFHRAVNRIAGQLEDNLLVTAGGAGRLVGDLELPALRFGVMGIHTEKVAGKDGRLVAAGTAANFHDGVLGIVRIGGNQQQTDALLHFRQLRLNLGNLLPRHLLQLVILLIEQDILRRGKVRQHLLILQSRRDNRLQLLVILVQLDITLHILHHLRTRQLVLQRLELVLQRQHLLQ